MGTSPLATEGIRRYVLCNVRFYLFADAQRRRSKRRGRNFGLRIKEPLVCLEVIGLSKFAICIIIVEERGKKTVHNSTHSTHSLAQNDTDVGLDIIKHSTEPGGDGGNYTNISNGT